MSDNWVVQNLENALNTWNEKLAEIWQLVTQSPENFKGGTIWNVIVDTILVIFCVKFKDLWKTDYFVPVCQVTGLPHIRFHALLQTPGSFNVLKKCNIWRISPTALNFAASSGNYSSAVLAKPLYLSEFSPLQQQLSFLLYHQFLLIP